MLNIEYRTRNFEFRSVASLAQRKRLRRVSLCLFISIKMIEYLTSTFIIRYSIFKYFLTEKAQISELRAYASSKTTLGRSGPCGAVEAPNID